MKLKYVIYAWIDGTNFDANKHPDFIGSCIANGSNEAEDIGDRKARKAVGTCDVVIAQPDEGAARE